MRGKPAVIVIGERVNRLVVLEAGAPRLNGEKRVIVRCDCGTRKTMNLSHFRGGTVFSCGCYNSERTARTNKDRASHGKTWSTEFRIWQGMKARCLNPNHMFYLRYGGRGITICREWLDSFEAFYADMGPRPHDTTLDRIDNDRGYSPENCRWATREQQHNNKASSRLITVGSATLTITQWSKASGISRHTISRRLRNGWNPAEAVSVYVKLKRGSK